MEEEFEDWYESEGYLLAFNLGLKEDEKTKSLLRTVWCDGYFKGQDS